MKKSYEKAKRRRENGVRYKHDLGQHFLYDEALLQRLVDSTGVTKEDGVLEIGPGSGTLTQFLCQRAGRVVAVEVDKDILGYLQAKTASCENLSLVVGDIRKLDLEELCKPLGRDFFVIANIPYNITTPILELLLESRLPIRQLSLMVQKEVADKLMAAPSTAAYCLTSVKCQYHAQISLEAIVPRECFTPPPRVDSAFVHLVMRKDPPLPVANERLLFSLMQAGFGMRRKTLANALKGRVDPERLQSAMESLGLSPRARGEELDVKAWIALGNLCAGGYHSASDLRR